MEFGHYEANEILVSSGNVGCGNDEAVAGTLDEPLLELITNLLRAADDRIMHAASSSVVHELADRRVLLAARAHDAVADGLQTGNRRHLRVGECLVHALGREVEVERFRQKRERIDLERQLVDEGPFVLGLHPAGSGHGGDQMRDLDVFGIAPAAGHLRLEPRILALGHGDVWIDHEDELAPLRSEALAAAALARLDDYRTALRGPRHGERPPRTEKTPVVVEAMHPLRMSEQAARLILRNRVD